MHVYTPFIDFACFCQVDGVPVRGQSPGHIIALIRGKSGT